MKKLLTTPWVAGLVVALAAAWVLAGLRPPPARSAFDTAAFGRLPVLLNGRVQPIDSVARNSLLVLRGRQSVALTNGGSLSATDISSASSRPSRDSLADAWFQRRTTRCGTP